MGGAQQQQNPIVEPAKPKKRPYCWRCKCGGHSNEDCRADLDCIICNKKNSHLSSKCPILKMPKPFISFCGSGLKEFGFLRLPEIDYKLETPDPSPTALIKVTGGQISAGVIQTELARITRRTDWQWEALAHGNDSFLVAFPSDEEIQRVADIDFQLRSHGVTLTISDWHTNTDVTPTYHLDEVWVHITGVPHAWRHYLVFWALGVVIGTTLEVDMLTYRKKGVIRVLVGVLNRDKLPYSTDLVFGTEGYDIKYSIEETTFAPAQPPPVDFDPADRDDGGNHKDKQAEKDPESAQKKLKGHGTSTSTESITGTASSGPTPMHIAVTPFGTNRPIAPMKPIVMNGTDNLPPIAVTPFGKNRPIPTMKPIVLNGVDNLPLTTVTKGPERSRPSPRGTRQSGTDVEAPMPTCTTSCAISGRAVGGLTRPTTSAVQLCSSPTTPAVSSNTHPSATQLKPERPVATVSSSSMLHHVPVQIPTSYTAVQSARGTVSAGTTRRSVIDTSVESMAATQSIPQESTPDGVAAADEHILAKAMKRAAERNLDGLKGHKTMVDGNTPPLSPLTPYNPLPGYLLNYTLAPYMVYPTETSFTGLGCSGYSTIGAGGQGVFYPGTWVAV